MLSQRIQQLEASGLGLARAGGVRLSASHPRWKREFSREAHRLFSALEIPRLRLYHVGSTSIPGIQAKPVLDILATTPSLAELDTRRAALERIGYECKGEYGIPGRRYSVLYDPERTKGYVHLHAFEEEHPEVERHLVFRDYLRASPGQAASYERLKLGLVSEGTPRADYTEKKTPLIQELLREAELWRKARKERTLVLLGSSIGGARTESFTEECLAGRDYELVRLGQLELSPYVYGGIYPPTDAFVSVIESALEADLLVFASPVYWYAVSAHTKIFLDRFSDLLRQHKDKGERLYGKRVLLVSTGDDPEPPVGFEVPVSLTAAYFGMDYLGMKYRSTGKTS